ncbi:ABC transporter substrate-binding protein [Streptomyces endophyticus]|uniref:ABC transporter substrate-binding protein n=1 Tax=Streptomyces endophyticus TaxID=714166 RepID=A0ABU6FG88_9ACTN|nr:ABC transporter substrate-binding protein [Streptomyces endophyticus]MEB8343071.1 ABC transporter substrate-binding protein [Streptomyces endophyticus]
MFGSRIREWGPLDWCVAAVVVLALVAGGIYGGSKLLRKCDNGLSDIDGQCIGVTTQSFEADDDIGSLLDAIADENDQVASESGTPYVRVALMMSFTSGDKSAMTGDMIRRALAGSLAALKEANAGAGGPQVQLMLAPIGSQLDQWRPVVKKLDTLAADGKHPLVGVTGIPSSQTDTKQALEELSTRKIPTVGPVINASSMNFPYFFKTSPDDKEFANALRNYLRTYPQGKKKGLLLLDRHTGDVYSADLTNTLKDRFGKDYGLTTSSSLFTGSSGSDEGEPGLFVDAVGKICRERTDTVFFAGRDQDLPGFIDALSDEGSCNHGGPLRILKTGIGLEPTLTKPEVKRDLKKAKATIVDAASFDPGWEKAGSADRPAGVDDFLDRFDELRTAHTLGEKPLADGYAASYYDGLRLLTEAMKRTFAEMNKSGKTEQLPTRQELYTMLSQPTVNSSGMLQGATGTYGFAGQDTHNRWSVCKPVPVVEFPAPRHDRKLSLYRTYDNGDCPG